MSSERRQPGAAVSAATRERAWSDGHLPLRLARLWLVFTGLWLALACGERVIVAREEVPPSSAATAAPADAPERADAGRDEDADDEEESDGDDDEPDDDDDEDEDDDNDEDDDDDDR